MFTERNTIENFVIKQISGIDLSKNLQGFENLEGLGSISAEPTVAYISKSARWQYIPSNQLPRKTSDVLIEKILVEKLIELNPTIAERPDRAEEIIHRLRGVFLQVKNLGLVRANEIFTDILQGEKSMPYGKNEQHVSIKFIDYENINNNSYIITNQLTFNNGVEKVLDIVMFVNGIPLIVGELKTPVRPAVSWLDGATDIHDDYENSIPALFVPNLFSFATEGKKFRYGSVRMPLELWGPWREESQKRENENTTEIITAVGLQEISTAFNSMLKPDVVLDILRHFNIFATDKQKRKIKIICRYQQYEGANLIVERVREGKINRGLIWHFQGSGKSLLMVFAAQKLRALNELNNPTILIVVDRQDLDTQITGTFNASEIKNVITTDSREELRTLLKEDSRKIIITMIHKFGEAEGVLNDRQNIIALVDEAHRTQEGDLGRKMRNALPNAFLFGLTGTPINKRDRNTFYAFGSTQDQSGYMSKYSFQQSIKDSATLELHFEPRLPKLHVDKEQIDVEFQSLTETLTDEEKRELSKRAANMSNFIKAPERIKKIVEDIVNHYSEKVEPTGFKAQIVCYDRETCVLYKKEIDKLIAPEASAIVMTVSEEEYKDYKLSKDQEEILLDKFRDAATNLKFLIVTNKLLAGFDAPILQTMYLDKPLKDHNLLQGICRTNRLYKDKSHGLIVDYFGVFDDVAKALEFDDNSVQQVITNISQLKGKFQKAIETCLNYFPNVDRDVANFDALMKAQECIDTNEKRDAFASDYSFLSRHWEAISPDPFLNEFEHDYKWLTQIYQSVQPVKETGRLIWHALGAKTLALIHKNIHAETILGDMEKVVVNADVLEEFVRTNDPKKIKQVEIEISKRIAKHGNNPKFKALGERLQKIKEQAEQGIINSIEFLKYLIKLAEDLLKAEKEETTEQEQKTAKSALRELFQSVKTDKTPKIIENIVTDIDSIVKIVRFDLWQNTTKGQREVKKALRETLLKYTLHSDQDLFEKTYKYIEQYY